MSQSVTERLSPLDRAHHASAAKMVPFGGWSMPISYPTGTIEEHRACRHDAVMFDVSHLGTVRVTGPGAFAVLQRAFTNDLGRISPGRAQYTHLLDPVDASVLDDIIIWWVDTERFDVMPNASNTERITDVLSEAAQAAPVGDVDAVDFTAQRAVIAVQGPNARELVDQVVPGATAIGRFRVGLVPWDNTVLVVAGTGYTGEDGLELAVDAARAEDLWNALLTNGVLPAGLGARDTLRLEAGLPLHGHELGPGITPLQADLGWVVAWGKGEFVGRQALEIERNTGVSRIMRGLAVSGRRPAREGSIVTRGGAVIGEVTSGNFSPELGHAIALAMVSPDLAVGDQVEIDVRGTLLDARVVDLPFV
jgi:aminomethyltransferase